MESSSTTFNVQILYCHFKAIQIRVLSCGFKRSRCINNFSLCYSKNKNITTIYNQYTIFLTVKY